MGIQGDNIPYPLCLTLFWWYEYSSDNIPYPLRLTFWWYGYSRWQHTISTAFAFWWYGYSRWQHTISTVWHCFDGMGIQGDNLPYPLCLTLFWWYGYSRWQHTISTVWHCFDGMGIQGDNIPYPLRLTLFWWNGYSRWQHTISTMFDIVLMVWVFKVTTYHIHYVWHFDGMGIQGDNIPYPLRLTFWWNGYSRWQHTISTMFDIVLMVWVFKVTTYHIHYVWHFDGMGIQGDNIPYPLCFTLFWWYGYSRWQHLIVPSQPFHENLFVKVGDLKLTYSLIFLFMLWIFNFILKLY